ncbi:MAG: DUF2341 domain-containing protein, partial [Candidatus Omnitrophica bacterium]|nr:DUF2341 domain-containing protein [Candidatus Omnitrophota bacterium]
YGGTGYSLAGAAGTIYTKSSSQNNGDLKVVNNNQVGAITPLLSSFTFDDLIISNKGYIEIQTGNTLDTTTFSFSDEYILNNGSILFAISIIDFYLINNGLLNIPNLNLTIGDGGTLEIKNTNLTLNYLTIQSGGTLIHTANSATQEYTLTLTINNDMTIDSGGSVNLNAKGYAGGYGSQDGFGTGGGKYGYKAGQFGCRVGGGGASYAGNGGSGNYGVGGSTSYGSLTEPADLGSGGGGAETYFVFGSTYDTSTAGGSGGGVIQLSVPGILTINGDITASGADGSYSCSAGGDQHAYGGGGSGGSVYITTGTLAGTNAGATITANGGAGNGGYGGGGAGGRIAIYYTTNTYSGTTKAYGGTGYSLEGAAGTIYTESSSQINGDLKVDNNGNSGEITPLLSQNWIFDNVTISDSANLDLNGYNLNVDGAFLLSGGTFTQGINTLNVEGNFTIENGSTFTKATEGQALTFDGTGNLADNSSTLQDLGAVTIGGSDTIRTLTTTASMTSLTINSGNTLDLSDKNLTVTGTFSNDSLLKLIGSQTVTFTNDTDSGTVEYNGTDGYSGLAAGNNYYNLTFSGTGTYALANNVDVNGNLTLSAGELATLAYSYYKQITIYHAEVAATLTDYPLLFSVTDSDLKTTTYDGYVTDSNGYDIIFTNASGTKLDHEIEKYTDTSGQFVAWVRIPSLSNTENTAIYMYYGNNFIGSSQENITGVWGSSDYLGVWHFNDDADDSTTNYNGTPSAGVTYVSGKFANGIRTDGGTEYIDLPVIEVGSTYTLSAWSEFPLYNTGSWRTLYQRQGGNYHHTIVQSDGQIGVYNNSFYSSGYDIDNLQAGWHYVTAVASSGTTKFYIDDSPLAGTSNSVVTEEVSRLGNHDSGQQWGTFDEVRISNTARTAEWISTTYNNQDSPSTFYGTGTQTAGGSYNINIAGNFSNSATFTANEGTVTFDTTATSVISGNTSFYDLTCETAGKELQFEADSTQTITGTLTLTGAASLITLRRSTTDGEQWKIDPQGTRSVSYVDVQDSNNVNATIINPSNSTDSGNNTNWFPTADSGDGAAEPPEPPEPPTPPEPPPAPSEPEESEGDNIIIPDKEPIEKAEDKDPFGPQGKENKYNKKYIEGKYRTTVIVYDGIIVVAKYDKEGPVEKGSVTLTRGESISQEGTVPKKEAKAPKKPRIEPEEEEAPEEEDPFSPQDEKKKYKKKYIKGKYRTVVIVFEGRVVACPYDEEGPKFEQGTTLTTGQRTVQEGEVE